MTTEFSPEYSGDTPNRKWVRDKVRELFGEEETRQIAFDARIRYYVMSQRMLREEAYA